MDHRQRELDRQKHKVEDLISHAQKHGLRHVGGKESIEAKRDHLRVYFSERVDDGGTC